MSERTYLIFASVVILMLFGATGYALSQRIESDSDVRIVAQRLEDGRVEFGLEQDGERILPRVRYFPADAPVGRWLRSSPVPVDVGLNQVMEEAEEETPQSDDPAEEETPQSDDPVSAAVSALNPLQVELDACKVLAARWGEELSEIVVIQRISGTQSARYRSQARKLDETGNQMLACNEGLNLLWRQIVAEHPIILTNPRFSGVVETQQELADNSVELAAIWADIRATLVRAGALD